MRHKAILALLALLMLGGCSASTPAAPPTEVASTSAVSTPEEAEPGGEPELPDPRKPVDLIKQFGDRSCKTQAEAGEEDVYGNRYASCSWQDNADTPGTELTVRTYPGDPLEFDPNVPFRSTDSNRIIIGDDFVATITGDWTSYSKGFTTKKLGAIADKLGGEYLPPGTKRG
ncbi:hypothetical protein [Micropruina sp.]|uniref:hypothetical protein n=1 Tax=Micropruina sp. TaxID=2737536 RepID=UPI0039E6253E